MNSSGSSVSLRSTGIFSFWYSCLFAPSLVCMLCHFAILARHMHIACMHVTQNKKRKEKEIYPYAPIAQIRVLPSPQNRYRTSQKEEPPLTICLVFFFFLLIDLIDTNVFPYCQERRPNSPVQGLAPCLLASRPSHHCDLYRPRTAQGHGAPEEINFPPAPQPYSSSHIFHPCFGPWETFIAFLCMYLCVITESEKVARPTVGWD